MSGNELIKERELYEPTSVKPKSLAQSGFKPYQVRDADQKGPRLVGICLAVRQFGDIDIMNHTFAAEVKIYVDWTPTAEELTRIIERGDNVIDPKLLDFDPASKIVYKNAVSWDYSNTWTDRKLCYIQKYEKYFIRNLCAVQGIWREVFELENFPLDVQDLTMKIQLGGGISQCVFVPTRSRRTCIQVQTKYAALQDYAMGPVFGYFTMSDTSDNTSYSGEPVSQIHLSIKLIRKWGAYAYRIQLVLTMVSLSTMACFSFDPVDFAAERTSYVATMLLTAVAFQFIAQQKLPDIPYLTLMDIQIILNFIFIWCVGVGVSFSGTLTNWLQQSHDIDDGEVNKIMSYIFFVIFFIIQISSMIQSYLRRRVELEKLDNYSVESDKGPVTVTKITPWDKTYLRMRKDVDTMGLDVDYKKLLTILPTGEEGKEEEKQTSAKLLDL